jgi:hypothetical protein
VWSRIARHTETARDRTRLSGVCKTVRRSISDHLWRRHLLDISDDPPPARGRARRRFFKVARARHAHRDLLSKARGLRVLDTSLTGLTNEQTAALALDCALRWARSTTTVICDTAHDVREVVALLSAQAGASALPMGSGTALAVARGSGIAVTRTVCVLNGERNALVFNLYMTDERYTRLVKSGLIAAWRTRVFGRARLNASGAPAPWL